MMNTWFMVLAAVAVCAQALPTEIGNQDEVSEAHEVELCWSRPEKSFGFASFGNGTRGGAGGAAWTVWDALTLRNAITGDTPRIIYVRGRIDFTQIFKGSPGVVLDVGSWKTIIGCDGAEITGGGLRIHRAQQVIIQNIKFSNPLSYAPGERPDGNGGIVTSMREGSRKSTLSFVKKLSMYG